MDRPFWHGPCRIPPPPLINRAQPQTRLSAFGVESTIRLQMCKLSDCDRGPFCG